MYVVLPGIKSVEWAESPGFVFDRLTFLSNLCTVDPQGYFTACKVIGLGSFEEVSSLKNGVTLWKSTLTFNMVGDAPSEAGPICFRFTDVDGKRYLIGSGEAPYPIVAVTDTNPSDPTERRMKTVVVSWTSPIGVMECIS
jgi:hypothetical protein